MDQPSRAWHLVPMEGGFGIALNGPDAIGEFMACMPPDVREAMQPHMQAMAPPPPPDWVDLGELTNQEHLLVRQVDAFANDMHRHQIALAIASNRRAAAAQEFELLYRNRTGLPITARVQFDKDLNRLFTLREIAAQAGVEHAEVSPDHAPRLPRS